MQTLIDLYRETDSNCHEHLISTINVLIENNPKAVQQAKEMKDIDFKDVITKRLDAIQNDQRFNEVFNFNSNFFSLPNFIFLI